MFGSSKKRPHANPSTESVKISATAWRTCIFLSASIVLVLFVHTSLSPALPLFVSEFDISYTLASWALTAYMISGAVMTIIIGRLADIFGSRKMLLVELGCFAVGTALAGFAQDFYSLLIIRALQGIAVANTPLALKIVREQFPKEKYSIGASVIIASFSGGMVLGLVLGAQIVGELGWRDVFYISAPIAAGMFLVAWGYIGKARKSSKTYQPAAGIPPSPRSPDGKELKIKEPEPIKRKGIDVRGAIMLAVSLTSFLLAITFAGTIPATLTEFAVFLAIGIVSIVVFFMLEKRSKDPLVNLNLMFRKVMISGNMIFILAGVVEYIIFQATPTLATAPSPSGFGLPVSASGMIQLPYAAMVILFGLLAGVYISKRGPRGPLQLLIPGVIIGLVSVGLLAAFHATFWGTALGLAVFGVGFTLVVAAANISMITSNPVEYTGLISSTTTDLRVIGGAIGPIIAGTFMAIFVVPYEINGQVEYYPSPMAFNLIFIFAFVVAVAQAVVVLIFRRSAAKALEATQRAGDAAAA